MGEFFGFAVRVLGWFDTGGVDEEADFDWEGEEGWTWCWANFFRDFGEI